MDGVVVEGKRKMKQMKKRVITAMLSLMLALWGCSCSTQATPREPVAPAAATAEPAAPAATDREQEGSKGQEATAAPTTAVTDAPRVLAHVYPDAHIHTDTDAYADSYACADGYAHSHTGFLCTLYGEPGRGAGRSMIRLIGRRPGNAG